MTEFFTWATLATSAGAVLLTGMITGGLKDFGFIKKIPTQIFSYVIALVVLLAANYFTGGLGVETAGICFVNAVVVAFASNGGYEAVTRIKEKLE